MSDIIVSAQPFIISEVTHGPQVQVTVRQDQPQVVVSPQRGLPGARGPAGESLIVYGQPETVQVKTGMQPYRFPFAATLLGVSAAVGTAPTGATIVLDVRRNGVSVFAAPERPTIPAGALDCAEVSNFLATAIAAGDHITVDVVSVGTTEPGEHLSVFVRYQPI